MGRTDRFSFIRYSNCWEDSRILAKALKIGRGQRGLSIASGGDNTLALLLEDPSEILAFDINPTQIFCTELKMRAIEALDYEEALAFLGVKEGGKRLQTLERLKGSLSEEALAYFRSNADIVEGGLIHAGKFERYFQLFRRRIAPLFCRSRRLREFCDLDCPKRQREFYDRHIDNLRFRSMFGIYFGVRVMGRLGRDKSFYRYVEEKEGVAQDIKRRFEYGISSTRNRTNPYLSYILKGNFGEEALPVYLRKHNYELIRSRLDRITLLHGGLAEVDSSLRFDFFNLSDIFEYVDEETFLIEADRLSRMCAKGARIAYWNMQNKRYFPEGDFVLEKELSDELFRENQSFFYRDFSVYHKEIKDRKSKYE
ncbi:MAG: DUF3419 family protein [Filifactor alocis]|nr:DUF3419 family protein [Filifactor alocis]